MFHLIREESVELAREGYPDVDMVPEINMQKLEEMGLDSVLEELSIINR